MQIIAVINQKGGCGKTTTAINLGASLGKAGLRTLLVDMDPQSHCAVGLGIPEAKIERDISNLLTLPKVTSADQGRLLWRAAHNLDLIPSRVRLAGLESSESSFARTERRERALAHALEAYTDRYDVCLIDCPPSIGLLTFNALVAANMVIVPVETGFFSLQGAARQITTVRAVSKRLNTDTRCMVLPTLHEPGLAVADDLLIELRRRFETTLLPVTIHRDNALREAASFGQPITEYAPRSTGARDYASLASILVECYGLAASGADMCAPEGLRDETDWAAFDRTNAQPIPRPSPANQRNESDQHPHIRTPSLGQEAVSNRQPGAHELMLTGSLPIGVISSVTIPGQGLGEPVVVSFPSSQTPPRKTAENSRSRSNKPSPTAAHADTEKNSGLAFSRSAELARLAHRHVSQNQIESKPVATVHTKTSTLQHPDNHQPEKPTIMPFPSQARQRLGAHSTAQGVVFVQPAALGKQLAIAGDFNSWTPTPLSSNPHANTHEICLALTPGRHEYRLIVDGHWIADPYNTDWVLNDMGEPNSIIHVTAPDSANTQSTEQNLSTQTIRTTE